MNRPIEQRPGRAGAGPKPAPLAESAPVTRAARPGGAGWRAVIAGTVQLALVIGVIVAALAAYRAIVASAPVAERGQRERVARLVEVVPAEPAARGPAVDAWGSVVPARTLIVRPEVAGRIDWVHPEVTAGGRLREGDIAARIDPRDLELAVLQAEADIAGIEARIRLERGQAQIGERELTRLSRDITDEQRELVRRAPQMAGLEAELAAARALRAQAANALARTEVRVPFDALVLSEAVSPGTMLMQGAEAATLVASDRFHVVLPVPASALSWIALDGTQPVALTQPGIWPAGAGREGRVARLGAQLSETGRMAELIVEVDDPLALAPGNAGRPALLLGSFVAGRIEGPALPGAVEVARAHVRDGDTVWVMGADDRLEVRDLEIAWRGAESVLVSGGLAPGERIVTSRLAAFAPGMALRTGAGE